ncbi:uncharacterized protein M6B38_269345 [Iris pallida]|uniref:Phytochrome chromophore attachment site domain-containing protein n=1 Tax=Iris pallida TaxID=29817 RepID=A0AAX6I7A6_IRIPA|nr:uncharacterized protein M6B38_269345 [Iris pallida]
MIYKFHEDEHGEVVVESRHDGLEPHLDLHYPATDILQAFHFLFKQNRVRMIADCHTVLVHVMQDEALSQPLCLDCSTLCAPYGCHAQYMANMGSIVSLAMAVIINGPNPRPHPGSSSSRNPMKLWGDDATGACCLPQHLPEEDLVPPIFPPKSAIYQHQTPLPSRIHSPSTTAPFFFLLILYFSLYSR